MKRKGITLIEIVTILSIVIVIGAILFVAFISYKNKIDRGVVVDKQYTAGYTEINYNDNSYPVYHPPVCRLTIEGEKDGEIVQYTFDVPEAEYAMYNVGDNYPKE